MEFGYELSYREDGVYFTLKRADESKYRYSAEEILQRIMQKKVQEADLTIIDKCIKEKTYNQMAKIAEAQTEIVLDDTVTFYVDDNRMHAYMVLHRGDDHGHRLEIQEVIRRLEEQNSVRYGIDSQAITDALAQDQVEERILVASGKPPVNGTDGEIIYNFQTEFNVLGQTEESGRVNYKELNLFANVEKGQIIATRTTPTAGEKGMDVLGNTIDALDGKEAKFVYGKNVYLSEDGNNLLAGIDGKADLNGNRVLVSKVYAVPGDVDMSVGNIDFAGDVVIGGNVLNGFTVKAQGSIEVHGVVEGAVLEAGDNIRVFGGVRGAGRAQLKSGGSVFVRYVEQSSINAQNDVEADTIMHSNIYAHGKITVVNGKAMIVGGNIYSGHEVTVTNLGAEVGVSTTVKIDILPGTLERMAEIKERIAEIMADLSNLTVLKNKMISSDKIDVTKKVRVINDIMTLQNEQEKLLQENKQLKESIETAKQGKVSVKGRAHPGVRIYIGKAMEEITAPVDYVTFKNIGAKISESPYRA